MQPKNAVYQRMFSKPKNQFLQMPTTVRQSGFNTLQSNDVLGIIWSTMRAIDLQIMKKRELTVEELNKISLLIMRYKEVQELKMIENSPYSNKLKQIALRKILRNKSGFTKGKENKEQKVQKQDLEDYFTRKNNQILNLMAEVKQLTEDVKRLNEEVKKFDEDGNKLRLQNEQMRKEISVLRVEAASVLNSQTKYEQLIAQHTKLKEETFEAQRFSEQVNRGRDKLEGDVRILKEQLCCREMQIMTLWHLMDQRRQN